MDSGGREKSHDSEILGRISDGVLALDENLVYTYANSRAQTLLDRDAADIVGEYIWDVFPEAKDSVAADRIEQANASGKETFYERYNEERDQWFESHVYPDENGLTILFRDVTEHKKRKEELEQYERIVESLPVAVGVNSADRNGGFVLANPAAVEMFGAESKAHLEEHSIGDLYVTDADRVEVTEQLDEHGHIEGREVQLETISGDQFWASLTATAEELDEEVRFIGIIEDITKRKDREEQLRQLHEATQELVTAQSRIAVAEQTSAAATEILDLEINGVHLSDESAAALAPTAVSSKGRELLGDPPSLDEGIAWDVYQSGEPRYYDDVREAEDLYDDGTRMRSELFIPLGDHGVLILSSTTVGAFDEKDVRVAKLLANSATTVLSERAKEKELQERDREVEQAEALFKNAQDAFFVVDVDRETDEYRFERVNPAYESLTGLADDSICGQTPREVFGDDDGSKIRSHYDNCVSREKPLSYVEQIDIPEPGSYWDSRIAPVIVDGEVVQIVGATRNITEQKAYENLLEQQRDGLELLNEIVRHDIRNDLQVVASYAELLATRVDEADREYVERILNNAETAVELTRSARDLAGTMLQTDQSTEPTPLRRTLLAQIDDIRTSYGDAVLSVDRTIPSVTVDADEMLSSVFRNVLKNAIQHNDKDVPAVSVAVATTDDVVRVTVTDNGPGIPDGQKEAVFGKGEKGLQSEGTGIGLYLVNTLIKKYDGAIRVDDNEPEGAIVTITLPRV